MAAAEVQAKERLPADLLPHNVVLYQYQACPFCNKMLGDEIGKGAYGRVYKGLDLENGDFVAIKQVSLENIPQEDLNIIMHVDEDDPVPIGSPGDTQSVVASDIEQLWAILSPEGQRDAMASGCIRLLMVAQDILCQADWRHTRRLWVCLFGLQLLRSSCSCCSCKKQL
ncbi:uncharacterized protein [Lolium perenne]|uniref:uncharacterized protein isoform X1 n=1 Tax=Lolium perenne TaxID=4522 RepID=UPI0021F64266|nr:uncharacterized protein LOC127295413 isoform X1 [Lolium perenne]